MPRDTTLRNMSALYFTLFYHDPYGEIWDNNMVIELEKNQTDVVVTLNNDENIFIEAKSKKSNNDNFRKTPKSQDICKALAQIHHRADRKTIYGVISTNIVFNATKKETPYNREIKFEEISKETISEMTINIAYKNQISSYKSKHETSQKVIQNIKIKILSIPGFTDEDIRGSMQYFINEKYKNFETKLDFSKLGKLITCIDGLLSSLADEENLSLLSKNILTWGKARIHSKTHIDHLEFSKSTDFFDKKEEFDIARNDFNKLKNLESVTIPEYIFTCQTPKSLNKFLNEKKIFYPKDVQNYFKMIFLINESRDI